MRQISKEETALVSGAGDKCPPAKQGNNGFGNGGKDGIPGSSDFQDRTR